MASETIVITGGAGFVGAHLAIRFQEQFPNWRVISFDSLKRRGSELNLPRLRAAGVEFWHGDIRCRDDLADLPGFDLLIDCSAEPSVYAGTNGSPRQVIETNFGGTVNCLEACRERTARFLFLSTSRVYPIGGLNGIPSLEEETRFRWDESRLHEGQEMQGVTEAGISERFLMDGARSFYGASKLTSEMIIQEYSFTYNVPSIVNRCGILTGPWQMGKVDQGVVALWVARHHFGLPLRYHGFGGSGKQVRDLLHVDDLFQLILLELQHSDAWNCQIYNVGGGPEVSVSLLELTDLCREVTGREVEMGTVEETHPLDVRIYLTDSSKARADFHWAPQRGVREIVQEVSDWVRQNEKSLTSVLT